VAEWLTSHTPDGWEFKRGLGQARSAATEGGDVQCDKLDGVMHFECKRQKNSQPKAAMDQAIADAGTAVPIVITKDDRRPTLVTMRLEDWQILFNAWLSTWSTNAAKDQAKEKPASPAS
jgi:hypothetical protein